MSDFKFNILSDLHLDFYTLNKAKQILDDVIGNVDCDYHIIAGDLCECKNPNYLDLINHLNSFNTQILYVFGNHEYYHSNPTLTYVRAHVVNKFNNIKVLNNEFIDLNGVILYGGTMWFNDEPDADVYPNMHVLNDFNLIYTNSDYFKSENKKFFDNLIIGECPDIIITHHVPHKQLLLYDDSEDEYDLNRYYYCDDAFKYINEHSPRFWICGHVHKPNEIIYNKTRIINNAFGYPNEISTFSKSKILSI